MNVTYVDSVSHKNSVLKVTVQDSDHHSTFSQHGNLEVKQVDTLNQDTFVAEFLPNDYDKPNLELV